MDKAHLRRTATDKKTDHISYG